MPAAEFPLDVLHIVFDHVAFGDLLSCTHVSALWRAAGRRHPAFWKRLVVQNRVITPGVIFLFIERLNTMTNADATIELDLALSSLPDDVSQALLDALCHHIHRAVRVGLTFPATVAQTLRRLFVHSAPRLEELCVIITSHFDAHLDPMPAMFGVHNRLRHVTLIDVPFQAGLEPVENILESLTVFYFDYTPALRHVMSWLPKSEELVIACPTAFIASPSSLPVSPALRHLSLVCENWCSVVRAFCRQGDLASLAISVSYPTPTDVAGILPASSALCMCLKTQLPTDRDTPAAEWGAVAITTPDRTVTRLLHHVDISHMLSDSFLNQFIPSERLVILVVSLTCGFMDICRGGHAFPRLEMLCLGIGHYPGELSTWDWGAVQCHQLRTLAFQSEKGHAHPILAPDVERFIGKAIDRPESSGLHIVLKDVVLEGSWPTLGDKITVTSTRPRVRWLHDTGINWANGVAIRTDWMDI